MVGYFEMFGRSLRAAPRPPVLEHIRPAFKVFLEGLDLRNKRRDIDILKVHASIPLLSFCDGMAEIVIQVETAVVSAFVELVAKVNDTVFRPLFRRLFDWAFTGRL